MCLLKCQSHRQHGHTCSPQSSIPGDIDDANQQKIAECLGRLWLWKSITHYDDVIMSTMASQITSITIVYSTVYSGADQRRHQSSASLAFVRGIHRWPVNSPHKGPVTRKMFPFDDVIMVSNTLLAKIYTFLSLFFYWSLNLMLVRPQYCGIARSIPWLLVHWLFAS